MQFFDTKNLMADAVASGAPGVAFDALRRACEQVDRLQTVVADLEQIITSGSAPFPGALRPGEDFVHEYYLRLYNRIKEAVSDGEAFAYTYDDYLEAWAGKFGDSESADSAWVWVAYGRMVPVKLKRLTEAEFNAHLAAYLLASAALAQAQATHDKAAENKALADSFPHEVALLI